MLVHGNASETEATDLTKMIRTTLKNSSLLPFSEEPILRIAALQGGTDYVYRQFARHFNPVEQNSAIENAYLICEEALSSDFEGLPAGSAGLGSGASR